MEEPKGGVAYNVVFNTAWIALLLAGEELISGRRWQGVTLFIISAASFYAAVHWTRLAAKTHSLLRLKIVRPQKPADVVPAVVKRLQPYGSGLANMRVIIWSNSHRTMADKIVSAFELAGWETNYNQTAQESHNPHYVSGIEVRGFNIQLVNVAATAVTALGGWDVRTSVDELKIPSDNPKWSKSQQTIYITVGYPKS